jgi:hypothetical protein
MNSQVIVDGKRLSDGLLALQAEIVLLKNVTIQDALPALALEIHDGSAFLPSYLKCRKRHRLGAAGEVEDQNAPVPTAVSQDVIQRSLSFDDVVGIHAESEDLKRGPE